MPTCCKRSIVAFDPLEPESVQIVSRRRTIVVSGCQGLVIPRPRFIMRPVRLGLVTFIVAVCRLS